MKSHLLPLAAVVGTAITLSLTAITLASPADGESAAATQVRQMEHQSRLREWSQGLGIDLSGGGTMLGQAESERSTSTLSKPTSGIATSEKPAKDHDAHRDHDKRDHVGNGTHEGNDEGESRS